MTQLAACSVVFLSLLWPVRCEYELQASAEKDPGLQDQTGTFAADLAANRNKPMSNTYIVPNSGQIPDPTGPEALSEYWAAYNLQDRPRRIALIVEDMIEDYRPFVGYLIPYIRRLTDAFRLAGQPIVWTNWVRQADDNNYGALDRFYGSEGVATMENPMYVYSKGGTATMPEVAPVTQVEKQREMSSLHLDKFFDLDAEGRPLLAPMLQAWGVDTIVMTGAWTEDCILGTVMDAVDRQDLDVILIDDAVGTATPAHSIAIKVMRAAAAKVVTTDQFLQHMNNYPELLLPPKQAEATPPVLGAGLLSKPSSMPMVSVPFAVLMILCSALLAVAATHAHHRRSTAGAFAVAAEAAATVEGGGVQLQQPLIAAKAAESEC